MDSILSCFYLNLIHSGQLQVEWSFYASTAALQPWAGVVRNLYFQNLEAFPVSCTDLNCEPI